MVTVTLPLQDHLQLCKYLNLFRMTPISIGIKTYVNYIEFTYVTSLYKLRWSVPAEITESVSTSLPLTVLTKGIREVSQLGLKDVRYTLSPGIGGSVDYLYNGQVVASTGEIKSGAVSEYVEDTSDGLQMEHFEDVLSRYKVLYAKDKDLRLAMTGKDVLIDDTDYTTQYLNYGVPTQCALDHRSWGILLKAISIDSSTKFSMHSSTIIAYTDNVKITVPLTYYKAGSYGLLNKKKDIKTIVSGDFNTDLFDMACKLSTVTGDTGITYDEGYFGFAKAPLFGTPTAVPRKAFVKPNVIDAMKAWLKNSDGGVSVTVVDLVSQLGIRLSDDSSVFDFKVVKL